MGSSDKTSELGTRMMPYLAILRHDLRTLRASRLVRLWLGVAALLTLLLIGSNWANFQDPSDNADLLRVRGANAMVRLDPVKSVIRFLVRA